MPPRPGGADALPKAKAEAPAPYKPGFVTGTDKLHADCLREGKDPNAELNQVLLAFSALRCSGSSGQQD